MKEGCARYSIAKESLLNSMHKPTGLLLPMWKAPAIEYVYFSSTRTYNRLKIADIDPILYSEVMRDVDMTVSIAFVGGVDPETGNSTKELRAAIVKCTADLMKFKNVTVSDNFIHVKGALADYTIHLGSGNVRQVGGVEIPIIPVHSQHRGNSISHLWMKTQRR